MTTRIKLRRDTAANWNDIDPILALGEPGFDTDNNQLRIGDGVSNWSDLPILSAASIPTATGTFVTLPDFLDFDSGTLLKTGMTSEGLFFSDNAGNADVSYPIRSNFSINGTTKVIVTLSMDVNSECSDFGLCVFEEGTQPQWQWGSNPTRIAAQYNCTGPEIAGLTNGNSSDWSIPGPGTYITRFTYDPNNSPNVTLQTMDADFNVLDTLTYDETLNTGNNYCIGFAADQDDGNLRTYIHDLTIAVDGGNSYTDSLMLNTTGLFTFSEGDMSLSAPMPLTISNPVISANATDYSQLQWTADGVLNSYADNAAWIWVSEDGATVETFDKQNNRDNLWHFRLDGTTSFPNSIEVGTENLGFITSVTSNNNYNYWFNTVAVDGSGNSYVVGGRDDQYLPIVISYDYLGTVRWKATIDQINGYNATSLNIAVAGTSVSVSLYYHDGTSYQIGYVILSADNGAVLSSSQLTTPTDSNPVAYKTLFDGEVITFVGTTGGDYTANVVTKVAGSGNVVTGVNTVVFNAADMSVLVVPNGSQQWQINTSQTETPSWQNLQSLNAVDNISLVSVTGTGTGATAYVRWDNSRGVYDYVSLDSNYDLQSMGYANGDLVKIPGSWLGGVDGISYTFNSGASMGGPQNNQTTIHFDKTTYPSLDAQILPGYLCSGNGATNATVLSVASVTYQDGTVWDVVIDQTATIGDFTFTNVNNDVVGTMVNYWGPYWSLYQYNDTYGNCPAITYFAVSDNTDFTSADNWQVRVSNSGQAFIADNNSLAHVFGTASNWESFYDVARDSNQNYYLAADYTSNVNNAWFNNLIVKLDNTGETVWAKYFEDANNLNGTVYSVGVDGNDNVYSIGYNGDGFAMVTKFDGAGNVAWQSIQQTSYWDNQPTGCVDTDGNVYVGGSYYNGNNYVLSIMKLNAADGTMAWARTIRTTQNYDIYDFYDDNQQPFTVKDGFVYYGAYAYDINDDYYDAFLVKLNVAGTGLGTYGRWALEEDTNAGWSDNTSQAQVQDFTNDIRRTDGVQFTLDGLTVTTTGDDIGTSTLKTDDITTGGVASITTVQFGDDSTLATAGIERWASYQGDVTTTLDATMNGKFLHYNGNWGSSTIWVPSDVDVALPIGFSVTIVMDNFNGYYIYVNNNGGDANINAVGQTPDNNNAWMLGSQHNTGIYNLLKVAPNRWILSGPDVTVD